MSKSDYKVPPLHKLKYVIAELLVINIPMQLTRQCPVGFGKAIPFRL